MQLNKLLKMQKSKSKTNNRNNQIINNKSAEKQNNQNIVIKSTGKERSKTNQKQEKSKTIDNTIKIIQNIPDEVKRYQRPLSSNKQTDFESELDFKYKDLKQKKQKMYSCIDLFNLMQSNNMQLRCTDHNNILTLYCISERRILCVNCTFGGSRHRTHKIIPLKDSSKLINQDNQLLKDILNADLKKLQQNIKNCQQNTTTLQRQMKKQLIKVEQQFQKKFDDLKARYEYQISKLRSTFDNLIDKNKVLQKDMQEFKFKIWQTLSKIGIGRRNEMISNQTQIIRQVFCVNISQLTKLSINKINKRQLQKILHKTKS